MLKKFLLAIFILIAVFVVVVATRPADFQISRSAVIAALPTAVFSHLNDFHEWDAWSPWAKLDPAMRKTYDGPATGPGSSYAWASDSGKVGQGKMTIVDSRSPELVDIKLEFIKPFAATNDAKFTLKPQADQTLVTWTMTGKNGFMAKAFSLFVDMDKLVGGDFEKGLSQLKTVVESEKGK